MTRHLQHYYDIQKPKKYKHILREQPSSLSPRLNTLDVKEIHSHIQETMGLPLKDNL